MLRGNKVLRIGVSRVRRHVPARIKNSSTLYVVGAIADIFSDDEAGHDGHQGCPSWSLESQQSFGSGTKPTSFVVSGWCQAR